MSDVLIPGFSILPRTVPIAGDVGCLLCEKALKDNTMIAKSSVFS